MPNVCIYFIRLCKGTNDCGWYDRDEESISIEGSENERQAHNKKENPIRHISKVGKVGETSCMRRNQETMKENDNLNLNDVSQTAIGK